MAFAARRSGELGSRCDEAARPENRSEDAIVVAALEKSGFHRPPMQVLDLARETVGNHRGLLDRLREA
ncbi:hypothetical protein [Nocardia aurantia]|uniref:Uncharacterized protein n=1 Tax=Nocardia aurantia TaxID=2585199 RepID=A0A7K0DJ62_9NOCA|nr:hypothetical protein [Nocardia aurantia]MQY25292.1 hypothetical protein [Nocardia aurantia]